MLGILLMFPLAYGVKILPDLEELTFTAGGNFTLTCINDGEPVKWTYPPDIQDTGNFSTKIIKGGKGLNGTYISNITISNIYYLDTGYYNCEPENAKFEDESDSIYVYVRDENHLLALNETLYILQQNEFGDVIVPCRPTFPDVNVTLYRDGDAVNNAFYDPRIGFNLKHPNVSDSGIADCEATYVSQRDFHSENVLFDIRVNPSTSIISKPFINGTAASHLVEGETAVLNCTLSGQQGVIVFLEWVLPDKEALMSDRINVSAPSLYNGQLNGVPIQIHYRVLTIQNVTSYDQGTYKCIANDHSGNSDDTSYYLNVFDPDMTFLNISVQGNVPQIIARAGQTIQWVLNVTAFPKPTLTWMDPNGNEIFHGATKYETSFDGRIAKLVVSNVDLFDGGTYVLYATNEKHKKIANVTLLVEDKPAIRLYNEFAFYEYGKTYKIECVVYSYPLPNVTWSSKNCNLYPQCEGDLNDIWPNEEIVIKPFELKSIYEFKATHSSIIACEAANDFGSDNKSSLYLVTDVKNGFELKSPELIAEGDNITLECGASIYSYADNISWFYVRENGSRMAVVNETDISVAHFTTNFSHKSTLSFGNIGKSKEGRYECVGEDNAGVAKNDSVYLDVKRVQPPTFEMGTTVNGSTWKIGTGHQIEWHCKVTGVPKPVILWFKNKIPLQLPRNDSRVELLKNNQTLLIKHAALGDEGDYTCFAQNRAGNVTARNTIFLTDKPEEHEHFGFILLCGFLSFVCLISIIWLGIRIHKEKKLRESLAETGLLHFEEGAVESLNPDLGIEDQADLLPYDRRWEFSRDKLKLGKQLGSGAFGVVMKAEADGIIDENTSTIVAVKMVKKGADPMYIKALASELKIMIHLGRHLNVVNLLGACTRDIGKRELLVIVEYCRFGNLHDFLLKERRNFIDQIDQNGNVDSTFYSKNNIHYDRPSSHYVNGTIRSDENSNGETLIGSDGYLISKDADPDWRSNYRGDYRNVTIKPITTSDLICWSFQISRGMEYLASRKVLHGDLAARNVLLADENIVKICDFGLAKSMYSNDNYQRKKNEMLPIRWMAIESMRDRVFSTQSDIWSYGITMWELFSLAVTPYPGVEHLEVLYNKLASGHRMERPAYATKDLYKIMTDCWKASPNDRPTFGEIANRLGTMMEEGLRSHYTNLNEMYLRMNVEMGGNVDYLSILNPPNYHGYDTEPRYVNIPSQDGSDPDEEVEMKPMLIDGNNYVDMKPTCFMNPSYTDFKRQYMEPRSTAV